MRDVCAGVCVLRFRCFSNHNVCDFAIKYYPKTTNTTTIKKVKAKQRKKLTIQAMRHAITHSIQLFHRTKERQKNKRKSLSCFATYTLCVYNVSLNGVDILNGTMLTLTHMQTLSAISRNFTYRIWAKIKIQLNTSSAFICFPSFLFWHC